MTPRQPRKPRRTAGNRAAPPVRIRPITAADIPAVVKLVTDVFQTASIDSRIEERFGGAAWRDVKGASVRALAEAGARSARNGCFAAVAADRIVGYVSTAVHVAAARGMIVDLAVAADCQGQGIGARLIARALRHFRALGLHHAKIETLDTNLAGQHLYPKLGFVEVARQIHYALPLARRVSRVNTGSAHTA